MELVAQVAEALLGRHDAPKLVALRQCCLNAARHPVLLGAACVHVMQPDEGHGLLLVGAARPLGLPLEGPRVLQQAESCCQAAAHGAVPCNTGDTACGLQQ